MADWEFDGSVNFAPPHYRKTKYEEAENWELTDEESAKGYIKLMNYIHYLHGDDEYWVSQGHTAHNIDNFDKMVEKEQEAWKLITDEDFIFKEITYEEHHKIWEKGFQKLRNLEPEVINGEISKEDYAQMIKDFNKSMEPYNEEAEKHHLIKHTLYWVYHTPLKVDMKKYGVG